MLQQNIRYLLQFLVLLLCIRRCVQLDIPSACEFSRAAAENKMAVGYNQELYNLIDEPDDSNIKESGVGKCALASFALIEAHFKNLGTQIDQVARDGQLKATMREVRTVLLNVEKVARTFKDLKIIGQQDDVVRAMRRACEIYNPKDLLHTLSGISSRYPGLFQELAEGTGYSETKFYQLASGILVEAEMAGVLAMKCILWAESPVSETLKQRYEIEITEYINETEIELMKAGGNLRQNFSTIVQNDMQSFLKYTTENHLNTQQSVDYIYGQLAKKFSFNEWVVIQFDLLSLNDFRQHAHDPQRRNNKWFHVYNQYYTVIAYAADESRNCSWFGDRVKGKTLQQLFTDPRKYSDFVSEDRDMRLSSLALKEELIGLELPQPYSISIIKFRANLKLAHGISQPQYYFFEDVRLLNGKGTAKHVLIGWC